MKFFIFLGKNRIKSGNSTIQCGFMLFVNRTKPGTALIETALTGDPLYFWKVLKNRSNEIRTNEICIRRKLPAHICNMCTRNNSDFGLFLFFYFSYNQKFNLSFDKLILLKKKSTQYSVKETLQCQISHTVILECFDRKE